LRLARLLLAVMALAAPPVAQASIALRDDLGRRVEMPRPAQRIVTLAPFLTELAYAAGAGAQMVGASAHSDFPTEARALPQVASAMGLSIEAVAALHPDLVLAWQDSIRPEDIARLEPFGIAVFVAQARRLDDVPRLLEAIGRLSGHDAAAGARAYRASIAALRERHARLRPMPVFLEIWHRPLTTIAGAHWMNEALAVCGARNAFDDLPGVAPAVSWELVHARDPWAIVGAGSAAGPAEFAERWRARATLGAVRAGRLVFVEADAIQRPSLRLADGVRQLCEGLDRLR
jgi:iron complex transport system substrate-binding protein